MRGEEFGISFEEIEVNVMKKRLKSALDLPKPGHTKFLLPRIAIPF